VAETARWHTLRGNKAERSPHHVLSWDTETRWITDRDTEAHTLRVWAARTDRRHGRDTERTPNTRGRGTTVRQLTDYIESSAPKGETLWCFAHNQAFDLSVTRLPIALIRRGWEMTEHALTAASPWLRMRKGSQRIAMACSYSYLPRPLADIGLAVGVPKPPLPDDDDTDAAWLVRCDADVDIVATAMLQLMDWWDDHAVGCWSVTGAASGWNAYRHIATPYRVAIERDDAARAWERATISGGRRECWRVGPQPKARYVEIDFHRAHLTICQSMPLPMRRSVTVDSMPIDDPRIGGDRWSVIADCVIRTDTPRYPVSLAGRTWHPVGEFATRLCGPELAEAQRRGELVSIGRATVHKLGHHMADWGAWLGRVLDNTEPGTVPAAEIAAKGWSRTVPGRWATRTSDEIRRVEAEHQGWSLERGVMHPDAQPFARLSVAGVEYWTVHDLEADDSYPAVLAWIQSHVRVALGRMIDALGSLPIISCNTDGVIVRAASNPNLDRIAEATYPLVPRIKAVYRDVDVISPAHLVLDSHNRLSGVPRTAATDNGRRFEWHTWPGLARQIERSRSPGYVRGSRRVDLGNVPIARWITEDGSAVPPRATLDTQGGTRLLPYDLAAAGAELGPLRPAQHPTLAAALIAGLPGSLAASLGQSEMAISGSGNRGR
jgi:hypothetical protein